MYKFGKSLEWVEIEFGISTKTKFPPNPQQTLARGKGRRAMPSKVQSTVGSTLCVGWARPVFLRVAYLPVSLQKMEQRLKPNGNGQDSNADLLRQPSNILALSATE